MRTPRLGRRLLALGLGPLLALSAGMGAPITQAVQLHPLIDDVVLVSSGTTPPTEAQCFSRNRRCFTPTSIRASYNLPALPATNFDGAGQTIVIVDSFGSSTIKSDLNNFNTQFGLPHMCGEVDPSGANLTCTKNMPTFSTLTVQGTGPTAQSPSSNNTADLQARDLWPLETSLDVEWAHSIAPGANILLVTTPTAETLGVQGFPQMLNAEQFVIDHHLGSVISQSFGAAEESFGSTVPLMNMRSVYQSAKDNNVTVFASSGDSGTANTLKTPVGNPVQNTNPSPQTIPFPTVIWPASDPLVTAVGGTYLCTNPNTGVGADSTDPPVNCANTGGSRPTQEKGWIAAGGGFSHLFGVPDFQKTLPTSSTAITSGRGVPDVGYQASSRTGVLIYDTDLAVGGGWLIIGGTSSGAPQWSALIAIANQLNGGPLGYINPVLYKIGANASLYKKDFFDVTTGNNGVDAPDVPGYPATQGWDPVTGLGTPNAANLLPDLVAESK